MAHAAALLLFFTAACGGTVGKPRIVTFAGQLPEAVVPLAWLEGHWMRAGSELYFAAAGPALFGVVFTAEPGAFDVLIIDAPERRAQLTRLPEGVAGETLGVGGHGKNFAVFAGAGQRVRYERRRAQLVVTTGRGATRYDRGDPELSSELDEADRLWSLANAQGTVAAAVTPLGEMKRHIVATGTSPSGELGFTVGLYRSHDGVHRGAYVAVWQKGAGGWTLRFSTSRRIS